MNTDDLPADTFTCGRCGIRHSWESFTMTALAKANGDGDPCLVCRDCRDARAARRRPVSRQLKNTTDTLRRAEARAADLHNRLWRARYERQQAYWFAPESPSERVLASQLAEANRAVERHRNELAALLQARASGVSHRCRVSRRTSHYAALPAPTAAA